jgi:hypothetical protein
VADFCEHVNEPSVSVNGEAVLVQLSDCQFFKKHCAPWSWFNK